MLACRSRLSLFRTRSGWHNLGWLRSKIRMVFRERYKPKNLIDFWTSSFDDRSVYLPGGSRPAGWAVCGSSGFKRRWTSPDPNGLAVDVLQANTGALDTHRCMRTHFGRSRNSIELQRRSEEQQPIQKSARSLIDSRTDLGASDRCFRSPLDCWRNFRFTDRLRWGMRTPAALNVHQKLQ